MRSGFAVLGGLPAGLCVVAAMACKGSTQPPVIKAKTLPDSADQVMFKVRTVITDRGLLRADVLADSGYFFDENSRIELRGVNVTFFTNTGEKSANLTSLEGTYNTRLDQTEARKHVVVIGSEQRRLTTEQLRYDKARNQISSDSAFVMDAPNRHVEGIGFVSDPDMKNLTVKQVKSGSSAIDLGTPGASTAAPTKGTVPPGGMTIPSGPPTTPPATPPAAPVRRP